MATAAILKKSTLDSTIGISTVVCGSFWRVEQIQNGGRGHGNQGAKNVKLTPYSGSF
jgi:hypothetical protein